MAALGSTTLSLSAFLVTRSLSRGTTATCENSAPAGFQHLVHPHCSVPPAKFGEPGFTPLSTAGWIEICAMECPPKLDRSYCYAADEPSCSPEAILAAEFKRRIERPRSSIL